MLVYAGCVILWRAQFWSTCPCPFLTALLGFLLVAFQVLALRELIIRGDFRTTVEYLATLLETSDFQENRISTEWLDGLIRQRVQAERPDPTVAIVCGALAIIDAQVRRLGVWREGSMGLRVWYRD